MAEGRLVLSSVPPCMLPLRACPPTHHSPPRFFFLLQGRTFPVEQLFLEDCHEATGESCSTAFVSLRARAHTTWCHRSSSLILAPHPASSTCSPGYILDADSPAALRPQWDRRGQRRVAMTAGSKNAKAVQAGWGDALADAGPLNPHFNEEELRGYR